ncbi:flagellar M-ring protein FliF [Acidovorax sp. GBBC 3334]|uniref:flagellar basal-body MS-ring/collar protein FliF n=1 Tax=Acidovorax sp. GBBC 3334 TaxID=2940496 RepID=UPI002304347F|nr:flagellar basal-body MS-ring/collar protein FliF [Acidovorax sp. GBBC 3334]MDA8456957.1 flagellar M-ring protein FliF [Acidovorax sp. GBBC 3334]
MIAFWQGLGRSARAGMVAGLIAIALLTAALAWWLLRADFQVLFSDLKPQDAAAMSAELEKLKIPYRFDEAQGAILVDKSQVHATRIKLMGQDMPLHGAVGFELFNNTDFGMTEFAQKINYQRALQGELTRTILSLSEIRDVRVHLAMPEQGLFKQAQARPKAAITITLREGQSLRPEQVSGIQRLVAAATPGMTAPDVTVVDRQGVALSRPADDAADAAAGTGSGSGRLELKKETESQLARKATAVLDRAFGPGQAMASVDVTLNMDQVRITTEDVIPAPSRTADSRGVIVKERESVRDGGQAPLEAARSGSGGASTQREVDYQVGRRVEQVVSQAGAVRRIQLVAVVRQPLDAAQEDKLRRLLAAAVGANADRGDQVVVQSLQGLLPAASVRGAEGGLTAPEDRSLAADAVAAPQSPRAAGVAAPWLDLRLLAVLAVMVAAGLGYAVLRRRSPARGEPEQRLSDTEREAALRKVQAWMHAGDASGGPRA